MREANSYTHGLPTLAAAGPRLIAVGLAILIAATWIPTLPVLTAMAILTLGATDSTVLRFHRSPALASVLILHAATYATLYALFVGAAFQLGFGAASPRISLVNVLDLFLSLLFLAAAARQIAAALRRA